MFSICICAGPTGVGSNELKRKLLILDPQHFSVTIPRKFTSCHHDEIMTTPVCDHIQHFLSCILSFPLILYVAHHEAYVLPVFCFCFDGQ